MSFWTPIIEAMSLRIYWQFYKDIFLFVLGFSVVSSLIFGVIWGFVIHAFVALIFGFIAFNFFKKEEFYFYFNKGITRWMLFRTSFFINLIVGIPIYLSFGLLFYLISGGFKII